MKTWNCKNCGGEMNLNMCQQGGLHVGCYDEYYVKPIRVWKVAHGGSSFVERDIESILAFLRDMDEENGYTITAQTMEQGKYESLGEFTGF